MFLLISDIDLKDQLVNLGVWVNDNLDNMTSLPGFLFINTSKRVDKEVNTIVIDHDKWRSYGFRGSLEIGDTGFEDSEGDVIKKNLYVSWRRLSGSGLGVSSKKYKVVGGWKSANGYTLDLSTKITKIDSDIAHVSGDSSTAEAHMHQDLIFQVE